MPDASSAAALRENAKSGTRTGAAVACPICDDGMALCGETALAEFGTLDIRLHHLACRNCGMRVDRAFHPAVGYRAIAR